MEKTATLNLRINPTLKADVDAILSRLGIPMSTAVDNVLQPNSAGRGYSLFCYHSQTSC